MEYKYNLYKLSNRTPHSFLAPGQQGVEISGFLVTSRELNGVSKFKEKTVEITEGIEFYIKVSFCSSGRIKNGIYSGSKYKHLSINDVADKVSKKAGVKIKISKYSFMKNPDFIHGESVKNAFEIYGEITHILEINKLLEVLNNGIGNRKSYGFGQLILFNPKNI